MKPESYKPPGSLRSGKDGVYVNCCAVCKGFDVRAKVCITHDFTPAKSGRCENYVDEQPYDGKITDSLGAYQEYLEGGDFMSSSRGGFNSLAALVSLSTQLVHELDQMELEPTPTTHSSSIADWLAEKRQWISEKEGQERLKRWQGMLTDMATLTVKNMLLLLPSLRIKWERPYMLRILACALLGQWYEIDNGDFIVVEIISITPLMGRTSEGVTLALSIDQLGECLTA